MPAQGGDFSFLDQVPAEPGDGRAAGEALAQRYRAGGSSGLAGRRFNARPRIPRGLAPFERPAVATLLHLSVAEEAYHATNGRYGNLHELKAAGLLRLDVPFAKGVFDRARYRFELTGGTGEFKIRATPLAGTGRPFVTDENGFVLVDE